MSESPADTSSHSNKESTESVTDETHDEENTRDDTPPADAEFMDTTPADGGPDSNDEDVPEWLQDAQAKQAGLSDATLSDEEQHEAWLDVVSGNTLENQNNPRMGFPTGRGLIEFEVRPLDRAVMDDLRRRYPPGLLRAIQQQQAGEEPDLRPDNFATKQENAAMKETVKQSFVHPQFTNDQIGDFYDEWNRTTVNAACVTIMTHSEASANITKFRIK